METNEEKFIRKLYEDYEKRKARKRKTLNLLFGEVNSWYKFWLL
jgi:hypothetical protein